MTEQERLEEFEFEILPQQLFHVFSDDIDGGSGAPLEQVILVGLLSSNPWVLKHKPLSYWVDSVVGKCYKKDVYAENEKIYKAQSEKK